MAAGNHVWLRTTAPYHEGAVRFWKEKMVVEPGTRGDAKDASKALEVYFQQHSGFQRVYSHF